MQPNLYISLDQWCGTVEDIVPGAKLKLYPCINGTGYVGSFYQAVTLASKNPEASYWMMRYISSAECQREMGEGGWSSVRTDFYRDPKYQAEEWRRLVGMRGEACLETWDDYLTPEVVADIFWFNSSAAGKIYDVQRTPCHEVAIGIRSVDDAVEEITALTIELQTKFGTLPIREEF